MENNKKSVIGVIGLGVIGSNLARNFARNGFLISVFNRTTEKTETFFQQFGTESVDNNGSSLIHPTKTLKDFVESLETPRKILLAVDAGKAVDFVIDELLSFISRGDIIIDSGNSHFRDTQKRFNDLLDKGISFIGCGISGGGDGALNGPSLMPGGSRDSFNQIKNLFEKIAAHDHDGNPIVSYMGDNGAGHYVKMIHNGIEYGVMQIMAEAYDLLRMVYQLDAVKISEIFIKLNEGKLHSFLFEQAAKVLSKKDEFNDGFLIDYILDRAAQKGTGTWTAIDSFERGIPIPTIAEAAYARSISSNIELRKKLSEIYKDVNSQKKSENEIDLDKFIFNLENALYTTIISVYAQGFSLIDAASKEEKWNIDLAEVSRIWQGGCIIRADLLNLIYVGFKENSEQNPHIFEFENIKSVIKQSISYVREIANIGLLKGVPLAGMTSALNYFDAITSNKLPANLIQGLRDNFGSHSYERIDKKGDFHTMW